MRHAGTGMAALAAALSVAFALPTLAANDPPAEQVPGTRIQVRADGLPPPYTTPSVSNPPQRVKRPDNPPFRATPDLPPGVVILGGAHGTLALARSLGRKGVPVWLVSNDTPLPTWSRRIVGHREWAGPDSGGAPGFLLDLAGTENLRGALLVPGGDGEVRFAAQAVERLSASYRVMLPPWERLLLGAASVMVISPNRTATLIGLAIAVPVVLRQLLAWRDGRDRTVPQPRAGG